MRVVNENYETITEYDLTKGYLVPTTLIKEDAQPIDNITKYAWADDDYVAAQMYLLNPAEESADPEPTLQERVASLETELVAAKILLGVD